MRSAFLFSIVAIYLGCGFSFAQDPNETRRRLNDRLNQPSTGTNLTPRTPQTTVATTTYLTKDREWTAADGRKLTARLVAFSAPQAGQTGKVEVIKEGKIRIRPTGSKVSSDIAIEKLAPKDQNFVKSLQIRFSTPPPQK